MDLKDRILAKLDKTTECWIWSGAKNKKGYGVIGVKGSCKLVHRVFYEIHLSKSLTGFMVLHKCDNPPCCNPEHLYVGLHKDNMTDRNVRGRTACGDFSGARTKPLSRPRGESNHSKLKATDVVAIRERANRGELQNSLASEFMVHSSTISDIVMGKKWKSVGGPIRQHSINKKETGYRSAKKRWGFELEQVTNA